MATRQLKYETLAPKERNEQEEWAQKQLKKSICFNGYKKRREIGGYRCQPGEGSVYTGSGCHFITDELLVEGKGRQYFKLRFHHPKNSWRCSPHVATLILPDGSLWDGPWPQKDDPDDYPDEKRDNGRKLRIDSRGQKWEFMG